MVFSPLLSLSTVVFRVCCVTENGAGSVQYRPRGENTKPNKKIMTSFYVQLENWPWVYRPRGGFTKPNKKRGDVIEFHSKKRLEMIELWPCGGIPNQTYSLATKIMSFPHRKCLVISRELFVFKEKKIFYERKAYFYCREIRPITIFREKKLFL